MASHTQDDGFHEIQLNGKQLVFLFMAATVVSVVIFLCGVLVGRGVRAERGIVAQAAAMNEAPVPDVVPAAPAIATAIPAGADPTTAAPPQPVDDLSYFDRLERPSDQPVEDLKPAATRSVRPAAAQDAKSTAAKSAETTPSRSVRNSTQPVVKASPAPVPAQTPPPPAMKEPIAAAAITAAPVASAPGDGYAVQVAAVNARGDADAIVKRLASKGYAAYVQVPPSGTGTVFRVRVGTFKTRREADLVAARLQKEEQIKPWVTR